MDSHSAFIVELDAGRMRHHPESSTRSSGHDRETVGTRVPGRRAVAAVVGTVLGGLLVALIPEAAGIEDSGVVHSDEPAAVTAVAGNRATTGTAVTARIAPRDRSEPVFEGDFADPAAMVVGRRVYAFATNTAYANVPAGSAGLAGTAPLDHDALPMLPRWSERGHVWAPSPLDLGGQYRLYYTTRHTASGRQCISVASADEPGGPFVDSSDGPLVCQLDEGGSIDPSPIVVDGEVFLLWKNDGNCCGLPTRIYSARLTADGRRLASSPVALIGNDRRWEGQVVEAPSMVQVGERFLLLYAGNEWNSAEYATGYAWCATVSGPCEKGGDAPFLSTNDDRAGPGGAHVFAAPAGRLHVMYHAWTGGRVGYDRDGVRALFVEPLTIVDGIPQTLTSSDRAPIAPAAPAGSAR